MPSTSGYFATRLDAEWEHLAGSPVAVRTLVRWGQSEPALADFTDLEALRAAAQDRDNLARGDQILAALVRLAAITGHDDILATRVVMQLLIPGAVRLSNTLANLLGDPATSEALVFSELAIRIRTYPWQRRPHRIAANLLLDCRQQLTRAHRRTHPEIAVGLEPTGGKNAEPSPESDSRLTLLDLLSWARRHRILSTFEERLLLASYVADIPMETLAAATGRSRSNLFRTRTLAQQRLRQAAEATSW